MNELIEKAKAYFQKYIEQEKIHTISHDSSLNIIELIYKNDEDYCTVAFCPEDVLVSWFYKKIDGSSPLFFAYKNDIKEIPTQYQQLVQQVQQDLIKFNEEHALLIQPFKSNSKNRENLKINELLNQFTFTDIKEQFLDLYPEENDAIKEYEAVYTFLRDSSHRPSSNLPNLVLSFIRNDKIIPTLTATLSNDVEIPFNSFDWSLAKTATLTDEMLIECSLERIAAITLYDFGSILIYTYAYPDTFVLHKE